jgi:secreted trypsin-like serine protease
MVFATRVCFFSFFLLVQAATCLETPYNAIEDKVKSILGDAGENGIVGGDDADPGSFTHQVALFSNSGLFICGGSLVSADIVVTAVHCTDFVAVAKVRCYP